MSYAPRSLSYSDGVTEGARKERQRILDLMFSERFFGHHDMYDTQTIREFTELVELIESPDNEN